jgi:hypothetical protein
MKNTEILDVGCGHVVGHHKRGFIGIDLRRGKADIIGDVNYLPIRNNAFGKVLCYYVIEHVIDIPRVIGELIRVAEREIEIVTDNALFYRIYLLRFLYLLKLVKEPGYINVEHVHAFYPSHLKHLLQRIRIKARVISCNVGRLHKMDRIMLALTKICPQLKSFAERDIMIRILKESAESES